MKISLPAEVCKKAHKVLKVSARVSAKTLPVLSYIKVEVDEDGILFTSNNLDMSVVYDPGLSYTGGSDIGVMLIPLALLDVIGDGVVTFSDDGGEVIRDYLGKTKDIYINPSDCPVWSAQVDKLVSWFSIDQIKDLVSLIPFCSKDETRPNLCAVRLFGKEGFIRFDATDGYKLGMIESAPAFEYEGEQLVPRPVLEKLKGLLTTVKPNTIGWGIKTGAQPYGSFWMEYGIGNVELRYMGIDGRFPNADAVRYPGAEYAEIETDKLRLCAESAVKSKQEHISIDFHDGKMSFGDSIQPFPLTFKDAPIDFTIRFNPGYLKDCLSLFNGHCQLHAYARNCPATFKADGREVILMPIIPRD